MTATTNPVRLRLWVDFNEPDLFAVASKILPLSAGDVVEAFTKDGPDELSCDAVVLRIAETFEPGDEAVFHLMPVPGTWRDNGILRDPMWP